MGGANPPNPAIAAGAAGLVGQVGDSLACGRFGHVPSQLVVLGSSGAWPEAGRACGGSILEHEGFRLVMDLGYGTLPRLLAFLDSDLGDGIDAVVVTHEHPDHMVDVHGLFRARWFGRRAAAALPLYAPTGVLERLCALEDDGGDDVVAVFDWHPLPAEPYQVGPFRLRSWALPHYVPNAGIRLEAEGLVVAYTGDTGPDAALVELARGADVFVAEASDRHQQPTTPPAREQRLLHLDASEAGEVAAAADVRRLLLTHFWPGNDRERSRADARRGYPGPILLADEGLVVPLP